MCFLCFFYLRINVLTYMVQPKFHYADFRGSFGEVGVMESVAPFFYGSSTVAFTVLF